MPTATATKPTTPQAAIAALKVKLAKADADLARCDEQIAASKADADAAYQAKDTAALQKLFARQQALEAQRASYAEDAERLADALRAACAPLLDAVAQEAHAAAAAYQRDQDAAVAALSEHAAGCVQAVEALRALPTWTQWGALLGAWKQRYQAVLDDAGVTLDVPALPDPVALPIAAFGQAMQTIRALATVDKELGPDRLWK